MSQTRHHERGTHEQHDQNGDAQVAHGRSLRRRQADGNGPLASVKHHLANARSKVGAETTAQLVWILGPRLPEPEGEVQTGE